MTLDDILGGVVIDEIELAKSMLFSFITDAVFFLVGYIFRVIAIYVMAKRKGFKKLFLCFLPFTNLYMLGKVIGATKVWGIRFKNLGLWLMISTILTFIFEQAINVSNYIFVIERVFVGGYFEFESQLITDFLNGTGTLFNVVYYSYDVVSLIQLFFTVSLIFLVFRCYKPERSTLFALLSIFIEPLFGILLFAVRNNNHITIDDFLRIRAAQNQAKYGQWYGGSNYQGGGNNYQGGQYNGYNNSAPQQEKDPFPEFSNEKPKSSQNNQNSSESSKNFEDDLFN